VRLFAWPAISQLVHFCPDCKDGKTDQQDHVQVHDGFLPFIVRRWFSMYGLAMQREIETLLLHIFADA
jgi:hypothetical protein